MHEPFHHIAATTVRRDKVLKIDSDPGRRVRQVATISRKSAMMSGALERTGTAIVVSIFRLSWPSSILLTPDTLH